MAYANVEVKRAKDRARRMEAITRMRSHLGGRCVVCGSTQDLEIHHRDPANKSFNPTQRWTKKWPEMLVELAKCELRCHSHHMKCHEALHGTISKYINNGCRCEPCVAAFRQYDREKHQRYREAKRKAA